jgi:hypothetical protein
MEPAPAITREQSEQQVLIAAAVGATISALLVWRSAAALKFNRFDYPKLLHSWQSGFLCRGCGAIFHPRRDYALPDEGW